MATVTLHEYIARIETLLQEEAYERVIALCQNGLRSYPRCVDFYRLLGQACLETERPDDAADMFRRVLGVDPQNFVARVGLGVVAEGLGAEDEALWQWERALELEPNHAAIRDEWQRLRAKRDHAAAGGRMKLNRAALGYIYQRGEEYERAATEFRSVLAGIPAEADGKHERFDLQVALAEALYRAGRQREAGELCQQVLKILPNALKPSLILGDIDHETGRADEARLLFEQAQSIDPENLLASQLLNPPVRLPKRVLSIDEPDSTALIPASPQQALAGSSQAFGAHEPLETPAASESISPEDAGLPEWLRTLRVHRANVSPAPTEPLHADVVERFDSAGAPEWLREAAETNLHELPAAPGLSSAPVAEHKTPTVESELPAPPPQEPAADVPVDAEMPDWLQRLRQRAPAESPASLEAEAGAPKIPDLLAQLHQDTAVAPGPSSPAVEPETPVGVPQPAATPAPDWLAELRQLGANLVETEPLAAPPGPMDASGTPPVAVPAPSELESAAQAEAPSLSVSPAESREAAPEVKDAIPPTQVPADSPPADTHVVPARAPREVTAFLDDSSAPPSVESQEAPTGATEYQARLDLARVMRDIDLESALELYALMGGASALLRGQAIAEVGAIAEHHPQALETLRHLQASEPAYVPPVTDSVKDLLTEGLPPDSAGAEQAAPSGEAIAKSEPEPAPPTAASAPLPLGTAEAIPAFDAAATYLDDAAVPPSIEAQVVPTGAAQYAARLELARMLVDLDLDTALDQYELMVGAGATLVQQAVADLMALTAAHAEVARTHVVLDLLQGSLAHAPAREAGSPPSADVALEPPVVRETTAPPAPEAPAVSSAPLTSAASLEAASAAAGSEKIPPSVPVVSEEAMEAGTSTAGAQLEMPTLPVVDASLADEDRTLPVPREPVAPLAGSAARPALESHIAPAGKAAFQARLDLARAVKFIDVDEALELYGQLAGADEAVRQEAIADLQAMLPAHPRAQALIARLQGLQPPTVAHAAAEPAVPEWMADAQTPAPADTFVAPAEPVVAEEAMQDELVAPAAPVAPPAVAPVVAEEMVSEPSPPALPTTPGPIAVPPSVAPLVAEAVTPVAHEVPAPVVHEGIVTTAAEPLVAEAVAPVTREPLVPVATQEGIATVPVEPVVAEAVAPVTHEPPVPVATQEGIATVPVEPAVAEAVAPVVHEPPAPAVAPVIAEAVAPVVHEPPAVAPVVAALTQAAHEALVAAVAPEGIVTPPAAQPIIPPQPTGVPREAVAFLDDASAPLSVEAQAAPSVAAEPQARLELARALREVDLQASASQYKSLIDGNTLLPQVISDLQSLLHAQPAERSVRVLLAEALAQAGRHQEAVEHYRKLV
jgi:tetratricopeptide (TPR) repeat protein